MSVSVVIVNWNTGDLLSDCVRSVLDEGCDAEILIVDNASSDSSVARVKEAFPSVKIVENRENLGFARASNQGVRVSTGNRLLLLNPDTRVLPGAIKAMMRFLDEHPQAGAVGAKLLNGDGSLQVSAYPEPTLFREFWRLLHLDVLWASGSYRMGSWRTDRAREVDVLTGACILMRREVLEGGDLLDERYFIYSEDQDLCRRLRSRGWKLFWVPQAQVVHYGGQSTRQVKLEMFVQLYREKVSYFRKHHGSASARMYKVVLFVASAIRQILSPLALFVGKSRRLRTLETARHYRRLVRELRTL